MTKTMIPMKLKVLMLAAMLLNVAACQRAPRGDGTATESEVLSIPECVVTAPPDSLSLDAFYTKYVDVNGIPLSGATFDGKLFAGQDITLTATAGEGQNVVKGWDITQVNSDGTRTTTTAEGPHYAFTMPVCASLSLQARVETSGITTMVASGTADKAAPQWFTIDGRQLAARPQRSGLYIHGGRKVLVK